MRVCHADTSSVTSEYNGIQSKNYLTLEDTERLFDAYVDMWNERKEKGKQELTFDPEGFIFCIMTLVSCALRPTEILDPIVSDFDLENNVLVLQRTKTGFKRCKCSKWDKRNKLVSSDTQCGKCHGEGKTRIAQYATIWPNVSKLLKEYFKKKGFKPHQRPFPFYRERMYWYVREATERAGIKIFEIKEGGKIIKNGYVRIFRQSSVMNLRDTGIEDGMLLVKLRHIDSLKRKFPTLRYTSYDVNDLRRWESQNIDWPKLPFRIREWQK